MGGMNQGPHLDKLGVPSFSETCRERGFNVLFPPCSKPCTRFSPTLSLGMNDHYPYPFYSFSE